MTAKPNVYMKTTGFLKKQLATLLFYFRFVKCDNPTDLQSVIRAKKKPRIPVVFSRQEVRDVICVLM